MQFENVLQRGLLEFAFRLPNHAPEYRYVMHEVIEEGQHSLMFQEFVNRTRLPIAGPAEVAASSARARWCGWRASFPELFFLFVLGGEDPIDHVQREHLRTGQYAHPLLRRISQVHITEEARHLSFARAYLRQHVPQLSAVRSGPLLRVRTPLLLRPDEPLMMQPPAVDGAPLRDSEGGAARGVSRAGRARAAQRRAAQAARAVHRARHRGRALRRLWRRMGIWASA